MLIPFLLAVVTIPYVIHKLGVERFGILSLAYVLLGGYASLFDLGMGRATTYFVADSLGRGERDKVPRVAFTSLCVQVCAGIVACAALALLTPMLAGRLLHISASLQGEARMTFWWTSASFPLLAVFRNLRAILEAHQRFDLITAVQVPSSSLTCLLPAVGAWAGLHLPGIMALLTASRFITTGAYLIVCHRIVPNVQRRIGFERQLLRSLFGYGGWVMLCDGLIPVINYSDRFVIGAVLSVQAVPYYTAPFEAVSKALIIPSAIVQALFPVLGTLRAASREQFARLYAHGLKYTLLIMTPLIIGVILFAGNILAIWIGKSFAAKGTLVLQLLAVGMLLNAASQLPCTLLDAAGRPDLRAKVLLALVLPSLLLLYLFTKLFGVNGTAASWLVSAGAQAACYLWLSGKLLPEAVADSRENGVGLTALLAAGSLVAAGGILVAFGESLIVKSLASTLLLALFLGVVWKFVLGAADKSYVFATLRGG
jgi:O-antigen/teichoic acid export membrane protein